MMHSFITVKNIFVVFGLLFIITSCSEDPAEPIYNNIFDPSADFDDNPPLARLIVTPDSGITGETEFVFDASNSKEVEMPSAKLYYRWDFNDDGIWDTTEDQICQVSHQFFKGGGNKSVNLLVRGAKDLYADTSVSVFVNTRPYIFVNWRRDDNNKNLIQIDASSSWDYEDGKNLAFRWDFNNDGSWEISWEKNPFVAYEFPDSVWSYKLEVRDSHYLVSERVQSIDFDLPKDPVAFYPFNGNANDESSNSNHGSVYGAILSEDRFGKANRAYYFDGVDDYIDIGNNTSLKPDFPVTVSAWVNPTTLETPCGIFRNNMDETRYYGVFMLLGTDGIITLHFGDGGAIGPDSRRSKFGTSVLDPGVWYHIVGIMRSADDMEIYLNGVKEEGTYDGSATRIVYNNNPGQIGTHDSRQYSPPYYGNAMIDNIYLFDRALTSDEIIALFQDPN